MASTWGPSSSYYLPIIVRMIKFKRLSWAIMHSEWEIGTCSLNISTVKPTGTRYRGRLGEDGRNIAIHFDISTRDWINSVWHAD